MAGGGFESTVRLAKSSPEMWVQIFEQNRNRVIEALEAYMQHLRVFHKILVDKNWYETTKTLEQANEIRRVLLSMTQKRERKEDF